MKILVKFTFIIITIMCLGSCKSEYNENSHEQLKIVCTNFPAYDFTRQIAKDKASIILLIPPGSEIHSFDPKPDDIIAIENADMFIYGGGESDHWAHDILSTLKNKPEIISMCEISKPISNYIDKPEKEHSKHIKEHEHEDEHVWTSPLNAILICKKIAESLCTLDTINAEFYIDNLNRYTNILYNFDKELREISSRENKPTLIFADRFPFMHLALEYGFSYYAAFPGCAEITEPSAKTVAFLIDTVKHESIPVIFYVEFSNRKICDTIAEDTGARPMLLHSCHNITKSEFEKGIGYKEIMEQNIQSLKTSFNIK